MAISEARQGLFLPSEAALIAVRNFAPLYLTELETLALDQNIPLPKKIFINQVFFMVPPEWQSNQDSMSFRGGFHTVGMYVAKTIPLLLKVLSGQESVESLPSHLKSTASSQIDSLGLLKQDPTGKELLAEKVNFELVRVGFESGRAAGIKSAQSKYDQIINDLLRLETVDSALSKLLRFS
jgi:hypothetical protein